jgi:hypothetical protein
MEDYLLALGIVLALAGAAFAMYQLVSRSRYLLTEWAYQNGYELLTAQLRPFRKGPFWWSSRGQTVYRVEARDQQGNIRTGWVRCGSGLLGVLANVVEVKWDD